MEREGKKARECVLSRLSPTCWLHELPSADRHSQSKEERERERERERNIVREGKGESEEEREKVCVCVCVCVCRVKYREHVSCLSHRVPIDIASRRERDRESKRATDRETERQREKVCVYGITNMLEEREKVCVCVSSKVSRTCFLYEPPNADRYSLSKRESERGREREKERGRQRDGEEKREQERERESMCV